MNNPADRKQGASLHLKICCILNDRSGSTAGDEQFNFVDLFAQRGISVDIFSTRQGRSIVDLANGAAQKNYDIIVAGGGDGTVSSVASVLVSYPKIRLGVLPLGTLNHFARDLNIPSNVSQAVDVICAGNSEAVDMGCVNDTYFVNNTSVGLYPAIVKLRENLQGAGYGKWWAAVLASIRILSRFRRLELEVQLMDKAVVRRKTAMLFVGNNAYQTAAGDLGTRLSIQRGMLWINMSTSSTRLGLFMSVANLVLSRGPTTDTLIFEASSLRVNSRKKLLTVASDGEVLRLKPPLNYHILPKALTVIVPMRDRA
jgi:diacylglycerol kinase family enzyme